MSKNIEVKMVQWFDDHWYHITMQKDGILEDRWIPSVTTKLGIIDKSFLGRWRGDIGNREADQRLFESQERGSKIHRALNVITTGGSVAYNPWRVPTYTADELKILREKNEGNFFVIENQDEMLQVIKIQRWFQIVKPKILFSENIVYSLENNDAGTVDLGVFIEEGNYAVNGAKPVAIKKGNYILDYKTGNSIDNKAAYQCAAYLKCAEELNMGKYEGSIILHTGSKNKSGIEGLGTIIRTGQDVEDDYTAYRTAAKLWEIENKTASPKVFSFPSLITLKGQ